MVVGTQTTAGAVREVEKLNQDLEHLRLLSIFHYVVAGMAAFFACFPILHFLMGVALTTGVFPDSDREPALRFFGVFIMLFAGAVVLLGCHLFGFSFCRHDAFSLFLGL